MECGHVTVVINEQRTRCTRRAGRGGEPDMTTLELSAESVEELRALWDRLREEAISDADRHEIDEIFARQMP
jgi:hypothetical protein